MALLLLSFAVILLGIVAILQWHINKCFMGMFKIQQEEIKTLKNLRKMDVAYLESRIDKERGKMTK